MSESVGGIRCFCDLDGILVISYLDLSFSSCTVMEIGNGSIL